MLAVGFPASYAYGTTDVLATNNGNVADSKAVGAVSDATRVPAPPMTTDEVQQAKANEKVTAVADELRDAIAKGSDVGFGEIRVDPESMAVELAWKGTVPLGLLNMIGTTQGVVVKVLPALNSAVDLRVASERVWSQYQTQADADQLPLLLDLVMPSPGAAGLSITMKQRSGQNVEVDPAVITDVRSRLERISDVPIVKLDIGTGGGLTIGRLADVPPWYGGSRIIQTTGADACSSGFAITMTSSGANRMLSAGHCSYSGGANRFVTPQNREWTAGYSSVATTALAAGLDSMVAVPSGGVAQGYVYHGAYNTSASKPVLGQAVNTAGQYICNSGATSGTRCGLQVQGTGSWSDEKGGLIRGWVAESSSRWGQRRTRIFRAE